MPLPSGLRAAGERLSALGVPGDVVEQEFTHNTRPVDGFEEVDALGRNADIITGSAWNGGLGMPTNEEFTSAQAARDRLNDLREIGVYK